MQWILATTKEQSSPPKHVKKLTANRNKEFWVKFAKGKVTKEKIPVPLPDKVEATISQHTMDKKVFRKTEGRKQATIKIKHEWKQV